MGEYDESIGFSSSNRKWGEICARMSMEVVSMYLNLKNHYQIDDVREKSLCSFRNDLQRKIDNPEDYCREKVEDRLRNCISLKEIDNRDIKLVNKNGYIYIAPPVLMAMCIGQYQLAQDLVEKGYPTICSGEELGSRKGMSDVKRSIVDARGYVCGENYKDGFHMSFYPISLGQYVFWDEHMSEELRLYFWNHVHKEKEDYSRHHNIYCEKVFDFGMIFEQGKNIERGLGESHRLSRQVLDCLCFFQKYNPDSLNHIFDSSWERIFDIFLEKSQEELAFFLLDYVLESDQDKLELLSIVGDMQKCGDPNSNSPFVPTNEFGKLWVHFYKKMCTYYMDDVILREQFFVSLVYDYIKIYRSYDSLPFVIRSKEGEEYEKQFISILKSVMPSAMSFEKLLFLLTKGYHIEKRRNMGRMSDFDRLCQLYGQKL